MRGERVSGQINAIEALIVLSAILQVIDDLQRRAESVGGRPHGRIFFVHVENKTADRRRGQSAIIHQLRPVGVTVLPRVEPKGLKQIQGMLRAQAGLGKLKPQGLGFVSRRPAPGERVVEIVEKLELRLRRQSRVIGDIVRRTHEAIEGENRTTALLAQEP